MWCLMYLILDTETTGVTPRDRIVSICWALYDAEGREVSTTHYVILPAGFTIPAGASAIHGITTAIARRRGIPIAQALAALFSAIEAAQPKLYVGHNVAFDRPIVLNEYARLATPENISPLETFCTMRKTTDVCRIPHRARAGYKPPKLEELHRHLFRIGHAAAHDAAGDVAATARCYFELRKRGLIA